jgi:glycosyltransferase involved in cell wall biosynthesis
MTNAPMKITVYIPSYNQADYLALAFESVMAQTRLPDQIILIDDASTDASPELIRSYAKAHPGLVHAILNQTNQGIGAARRQAIEESIGDLVTYLDGDDLYFPEKLEREEQALIENPDAGYAYSNFTFIDAQGEQHGEWNTPEHMPSGEIFGRVACFDFPKNILYRCELVRRAVLLEAESYEPGLNLYEDFDAKLRIANRHCAIAVKHTLHAYRRHDAGLHRVSYAKHYDTLSHIYAKNEPLLDRIGKACACGIRKEINSVLAKHAWRAVKQIAKGEADEHSKGVWHYAKAGYRHDRRGALKPKHAYRIIRAMLRR